MTYIIRHIRIFLAVLLILTSCAEIDQPLRNMDRVVKIETKWLSDASGARKLRIYNKEYDKSGRLIKVTEYDSTGVLKITRKIAYSEGMNSEQTEFYGTTGSIDSVKCSYSCKDENGNIYRSVATNTDGDTVQVLLYKYDIGGKLINTTVTNADGRRLFQTNYFYNGGGSLTSSSLTNCLTGVIQKIDSMIYKPASQNFDDICFDASGNASFITTFSYDNTGLLTSETRYTPSGKIISTFIYDYIFY